jgi:hypothetical protein
MSKYDWTLVFRVPGGHHFFRDELSGRYSVADDGCILVHDRMGTPEHTDDGILWIDPTQPVLSDAALEGFRIPVIVEKTGEAKGCWVRLEGAVWCAKNVGTVLSATVKTRIGKFEGLL